MKLSWAGTRSRSEQDSAGMLPALRSRRLRVAASLGALALTVSTLSATALMLTSPAAAAPGDAFPAADPLVFVAQGTPTGLFQATTNNSGDVVFTPEGAASPVQYNGISYNTADNYLYGIVTSGSTAFPSNSVIRIGQGGVITRVGTGTVPAAPGGSWNIGAFGADGNLYIASSTPAAATTMRAINPITGAVERTVTLSAPNTAADFTLANGYFWGISPGTGAGGADQIERVDPATGTVSFFASPFATGGSGVGAAWTFGNGNLGFSTNATGDVHQVSVTNPGSAAPTFTTIATSSGPASGNNDGAASPGLPTDLSIVKTGPAATVPAGGTATYTLTVTNNGPGNSSGFVVKDTVPAPLTNVASSDAACTVTGNDVQCIGGRLLAGDSVTYTVTATVPAGVTSTVANSATVTPNEQDPTPGNNTSTTTALPSGVSIVKHAGDPVDTNGNGLTDAGDTIQYTFDVTNTGQSPLSDITVNDAKVGAVTCPSPTLAAGASETCSAASTYTITTADVTAGAVNNSATSTGTTPDGQDVTSTPSTTSTPTTAPSPGITVLKSADPASGTLTAGQVITYHFVVTNTGNVPMSNVAVNEGTFTGTGTAPVVDCPATTLAVGAQMVCDATYTLTNADVDAGKVDNSATASGTPTGGDPITSTPSTVTVPTPAAPGIDVMKTSDPTVVTTAGQKVTYSFRVTNTGNVTLTDVAPVEGDFSGTGKLGAITCPTTTLVAGQVTTCTADYTVTQADIDAGTLTNTATARGTTPTGDPTTDPTPSDTTITVPRTPAMTVVKSSDAETAKVGQTVTYSFKVTNTGNVTITDPTVTDTDFSGSGDLSAVTCPTGALPPGADITCTATYTVTQADVNAGELTNTATVTGDVPDGTDPITPVPSNEVTVGTDPLPLLEVTKTADVKQVTKAGQKVTYSFRVENTGNVTITDPKITDSAFTGHGKLSAITCPDSATLAPGAVVTCTATYTVVAADLTDGGELSNTATVGGTTPTGDPITSVPSTVTVNEVPPSQPGGPTPAPTGDPTAGPAPGAPAPHSGGTTPTGLAFTGTELVGPGIALAFLLLALGGTVLVLRRRSQHGEEQDNT